MTLSRGHFLTLFLCLFGFSSLVSGALRFNANGELKILQLTDQHYCEDYLKDIASQVLTGKLLNWAQPDFVMISGDGASGYAEGSQVPGWFKKCYQKFTYPMVLSKIPYGFTTGNHDSEGDLNTEEIMKVDREATYSIRSKCPPGIPEKGTFRIPIYSSKDPNKLAANIWVFDTGNMGCMGIENSWGCITQDQLDWYDAESKKIKETYGTNIHHIAFLHIPIPEYMTVYNTIPVYGNPDEDISCPLANSGLFDHILKNGDISATYVGHDHNNDFGGFYKGVELIYGRKSGYGGYGETRGGRVIRLKETFDENGVSKVVRDQYVIFENGTIAYSEPFKKREGPAQKICVTPN